MLFWCRILDLMQGPEQKQIGELVLRLETTRSFILEPRPQDFTTAQLCYLNPYYSNIDGHGLGSPSYSVGTLPLPLWCDTASH